VISYNSIFKGTEKSGYEINITSMTILHIYGSELL